MSPEISAGIGSWHWQGLSSSTGPPIFPSQAICGVSLARKTGWQAKAAVPSQNFPASNTQTEAKRQDQIETTGQRTGRRYPSICTQNPHDLCVRPAWEIPALISAMVTVVRYKASSACRSSHARMDGGEFGFATSEMTFVSRMIIPGPPVHKAFDHAPDRHPGISPIPKSRQAGPRTGTRFRRKGFFENIAGQRPCAVLFSGAPSMHGGLQRQAEGPDFRYVFPLR